MKKNLLVFLMVGLVGCTVEVTAPVSEKKLKTKDYKVTGVAQQGFFIERGAGRIGMGSRIEPEYSIDSWSKAVGTDSVTGAYELQAKLRSGFVEFSFSAGDGRNPYDRNLVYDMDLSAAVDLKQNNSVNVNYLTTYATELTWFYARQGMEFDEAASKAKGVVLECFGMPADLADFEHYSLYGDGEGDAMLAALSIVIERYHLENSMSTAWEDPSIDTATGEFVNSGVIRHMTGYANAIIRGDGGDSLRKAIEAKSPSGKVGNFEKYLSLLFAKYMDNPKCDASSQGKVIDVEYDYRYRLLVCDDSIWRAADENDFDTSTVFNPDIEYGTLVDSRDGRSYRTLEIGKNVWMAENLRYSDSVSSENLKGQTWCYDNDEKYCELFGRLYSWTAAMDIPSVYLDSLYRGARGSGICPEGWHLPNNSDAYAFPYLGGGSIFSSYMTLGQNESGFSMIPGGAAFDVVDDSGYETVYTGVKEFRNKGEKAYVWMSDIESRNNAWAMTFSLNGDYEFHSEEDRKAMVRSFGAFVRCVKDKQ